MAAGRRNCKSQISAYIETLHAFPALRAVRCELNHHSGAAAAGLSSFTHNQQLRSVALTGCNRDLDLGSVAANGRPGTPRTDRS